MSLMTCLLRTISYFPLPGRYLPLVGLSLISGPSMQCHSLLGVVTACQWQLMKIQVPLAIPCCAPISAAALIHGTQGSGFCEGSS